VSALDLGGHFKNGICSNLYSKKKKKKNQQKKPTNQPTNKQTKNTENEEVYPYEFLMNQWEHEVFPNLNKAWM